MLDEYQQSPMEQEDYATFQNECDHAISRAKQGVLKEHSGWKDILINLLIGVFSLGTAFIAHYGYTKGAHVFFKTNTDSLNKIDELDEVRGLVKYF